jgi:hypothetical protein
MLLPELPGPEIILWPVHEKSSADSGKKFNQFSAINSSGQLFFSPAPFELFGWNFGHLATLASAQPPTHPHFPFPSSPPSHPSHL